MQVDAKEEAVKEDNVATYQLSSSQSTPSPASRGAQGGRGRGNGPLSKCVMMRNRSLP